MHKLARHLLALTAVAAIVTLMRPVTSVAAATDPQAIVQEHCQRMQSTLNDMQRQDRGMADEIGALQAQIELAQSGSTVNIDKMVGQTLAEVRRLRKTLAFDERVQTGLISDHSIFRSVWGNGSTKQMAQSKEAEWQATLEHYAAISNRDDAALKDAEKRLDYWTQRETEVASGGVVASKAPPFALNDLKFRQKELLQDRPRLQHDIRSLQSTIASVCSSIASSKAPSKLSENATWSGTWARHEINGNLTLHQTGDLVGGRFDWNGCCGTLNGLVSGPLLAGSFNELHYSGTFELRLAGRQFTGSYRGINKDSHGPISGSFSGTCIAGDCLRNR